MSGRAAATTSGNRADGTGPACAARDAELGRRVAIDLLNSNDQPALTARFIIEVWATARCSHEVGGPAMVLEHLRGAPLSHVLREGRRLPPAQRSGRRTREIRGASRSSRRAPRGCPDPRAVRVSH